MSASKQPFNLLIVEDDQNLAISLKLLAPSSFRVFIASDATMVPEHLFFHAALVDLHLASSNEPDGLKVIHDLSHKNHQTEIVAMSGKLNRELMEKTIHAGSQRFLAKPLSVEEVEAVLSKIEALWQLRQIHYSASDVRLLGHSEATEQLRKKVASLRGESSAVLIEGETGTGKEIVAKLLNQQEGPRPFVAVNCSAIPENLFESEFFGHMKGAFTGADQNKIGFAEAANGGDLFLDEIEALPLAQQAKLLRFLESGEIRKVGAKEPQHVSLRVITASNIPLLTLISEKKFREDLYFRLSSQRIPLLPLRDRKADISTLAVYFIESERPRHNKVFDDSAILELQKYTWPGNVRELKRVCEQLLLSSPLPFIRAQDIHAMLFSQSKSSASIQLDLSQSLEEYMKKQEKLFIEHCLNHTGDLDKSCDLLKISKSSLYKKIKDLGIRHD